MRNNIYKIQVFSIKTGLELDLAFSPTLIAVPEGVDIGKFRKIVDLFVTDTLYSLVRCEVTLIESPDATSDIDTSSAVNYVSWEEYMSVNFRNNKFKKHV